MSHTSLGQLALGELVQRYIALSVEQFEATEIDDDEAYTRLYHAIDDIDRELRGRGLDARQALLPLLAHENAQVRLNAAHDLLTVDPARARTAMEWVARWGPGPQRGRASMSLQGLDSGQYKPT
jgi:hypothetical protein